MQEICYNCDAVKLTKGVCQISEFSWARNCQTRLLSNQAAFCRSTQRIHLTNFKNREIFHPHTKHGLLLQWLDFTHQYSPNNKANVSDWSDDVIAVNLTSGWDKGRLALLTGSSCIHWFDVEEVIFIGLKEDPLLIAFYPWYGPVYRETVFNKCSVTLCNALMCTLEDSWGTVFNGFSVQALNEICYIKY